MKLVAVFVVFFVGGPLLFRLMTRAAPTLRGLRVLGGMVAVSILAAVALRYGKAALWAESSLVSTLGILMMWLAWVGAMAFGAQALRRADQSAAMRRWSGLIGGLGTTVPWFGLAFARMAGA